MAYQSSRWRLVIEREGAGAVLQAFPDLLPQIRKVRAMLVIKWLSRLPETEGIVILGQEATDHVTAVEARSRALLLWPTMRTASTGSPDGFQIVDQDDVCARLILFQEIA